MSRFDPIVESLKEAAEAAAKREPFKIDGLDYVMTEHGLTLPPPETMPQTLIVHSLNGIVDYVKAEQSKEGDSDIAQVHVVSPVEVAVYGNLIGRHLQRPVYLKAVFASGLGVNGFKFGAYMDHESFVIGLQALFEPSEMQKKLLRTIGNITQEAVKTVGDDGKSQQISTRKGVVVNGDEEVPNPVLLTPRRTFREVSQPASMFILRLQGGGEKSFPMIGLWEADGGVWQHIAEDNIKDFLDGKLDGVPII